MEKKNLVIFGICLVVAQCLVQLGVFVTFPQMTAYAVSKDSFQMVIERLNRIELKIDKYFGGEM